MQALDFVAFLAEHIGWRVWGELYERWGSQMGRKATLRKI